MKIIYIILTSKEPWFMLYRNVIQMLYNDLKINPYSFGCMGELYIELNYVDSIDQTYFHIIDEYLVSNGTYFYNRNKLYFSTEISDIVNLMYKTNDDYILILNSDLPSTLKRYLLFTITEYAIHSLSKLLNACYFNQVIFQEFYIVLKSYIDLLSQQLTEILFDMDFPNLAPIDKSVLENICKKFIHDNVVNLREHVEMDNKIILLIGCMIYIDHISNYDLILSPLLGAAQIPPFFNAVQRHLFKERTAISFEYIKFSTYAVECFEETPDSMPILTQLDNLKKKYPPTTKVLILDESLGTGKTALHIKRIFGDYFNEIDTGAIEFRWDKKIIYNHDREWFDINNIDCITPISYRHYADLSQHFESIKQGNVVYKPYIPYCIYKNKDYHLYIANEDFDDDKLSMLNTFNNKAKIVMQIFYGLGENLVNNLNPAK